MRSENVEVINRGTAFGTSELHRSLPFQAGGGRLDLSQWPGIITTLRGHGITHLIKRKS